MKTGAPGSPHRGAAAPAAIGRRQTLAGAILFATTAAAWAQGPLFRTPDASAPPECLGWYWGAYPNCTPLVPREHELSVVVPAASGSRPQVETRLEQAGTGPLQLIDAWPHLFELPNATAPGTLYRFARPSAAETIEALVARLSSGLLGDWFVGPVFGSEDWSPVESYSDCVLFLDRAGAAHFIDGTTDEQARATIDLHFPGATVSSRPNLVYHYVAPVNSGFEMIERINALDREEIVAAFGGRTEYCGGPSGEPGGGGGGRPPIPTLSPPGVVALLAILAAFACARLRRRRV